MIIDLEKLTQVISIVKDGGVFEFELKGKTPEVVTAHGEIFFLCRDHDEVIICIGRVEKYEEVTEAFSRLIIRGRSISFSL